MFLSLLRLNPASADVQRDLRDVHRLHRTIMKAFPDVINPSVKARAQFDVLHRLEFDRNNGWQLYVQSNIEPNWANSPRGYFLDKDGLLNPLIKPVGDAYGAIEPGKRLRFRLRANPTRKVDTKTGPDGRRRNGRRVPLRKIDEQVAWLLRKAHSNGFELMQVIIAATGSAELVNSNETNKTFQGVVYEGILEVKDAQQFSNALMAGMGPGKAYGFGLLSIAPI
jgi:CRISPR system Cascade subunit CasE